MRTTLSLHDELSKRGLRTSTIDQAVAVAPVGLLVFHPVEGCVYANETVLRLLGRPWSAVQRFGWARAVAEDDVQRVQAVLSSFDHDESDGVVLRFAARLPEVERRVLEMALRSVGEGPERCTVATVLDITEQAEILSPRDRTTLEEYRLSLAPRLLSEVRSTSQGVLALRDVLAGESLSPAAARAVEGLVEAAERARVLAESMSSSDAPVESLDAFLCAHELWFAQVLGACCSLVLDLGAVGRPIAWTHGELHHFVLQLLVQVRDVAVPGSTLRLRTCPRDALVRLEATLDKRSAALEDVFSPLAQGGESTAGFAVMRRMVSANGARVRLSEGAVIVEIPTLDQRSSPSDEARPARILLVDDHPAVRSSLAQSLALQGHEVLSASGVYEALAHLTDAEPMDLIVTDVVLPDGDGATVYEAAMREANRPGILFISGYGADELPMLEGRLDDQVRLLQKPFRPSQLIEAIDALQRVRKG